MALILIKTYKFSPLVPMLYMQLHKNIPLPSGCACQNSEKMLDTTGERFFCVSSHCEANAMSK